LAYRLRYVKVRKKAPVFHISQQSLFDIQTFGLFLALTKRDASLNKETTLNRGIVTF